MAITEVWVALKGRDLLYSVSNALFYRVTDYLWRRCDVSDIWLALEGDNGCEWQEIYSRNFQNNADKR